MWDRAARFYGLQKPLERPSLRTAVALSAVESHHRLLDLGTGTGAVLTEFASARRLPRLAVGIDLSVQMLIRAKRWHAGHLIRADAGALPFDEASFDVVVAAYLLHLFDDRTRTRVLIESRRVLRTGGRLITITPSYGCGRAASILSRSIERLAEMSSSMMVGLRSLDPRDELLAAGFEVIQTKAVRLGYPSLCVAASWSH
ncbi:MAG: class I SAM-dependent methyltransferase [Actinobacteria bacterium]|nr:class I SAM-dependent methyltransferase [Actinomycetota bacterium]